MFIGAAVTMVLLATAVVCLMPSAAFIAKAATLSGTVTWTTARFCPISPAFRQLSVQIVAVALTQTAAFLLPAFDECSITEAAVGAAIGLLLMVALLRRGSYQP